MLISSAKFSLVVGLAVVILCVSSPVRAEDEEEGSGWAKTDVMLPFAITIANECEQPDLEGVFLTGTARFITRTKTDNKGITHIREKIIVHASGTGQVTGADYDLIDIEKTRIDQGDPLPFSYVDTRVSRLEGVGVPDMTVRYLTKFAFDANGNQTVDVFQFRIQCSP